MSKALAIRKIDEYAAIADNRKKPLRAYLCLECGYYHLTSMTKKHFQTRERAIILQKEAKKIKVSEYYDKKLNIINMALLTFKDWKRVQEKLPTNRDKFELYQFCIDLFPNVFKQDPKRRDSPVISYETWKKKVSGNKVLSDVEQIAIWEVLNLKFKYLIEEIEAEEFISA
ncbi:hypothetical protein ACFFJX_07860 [Pseudarcicella hirudinis]|uniref:hypothetical protein n=1 Tax=Pseudarcicella hirudinis TaxID=1079859 RepID=UPI0015A5DA02